ncbi:MAG: capsule assembly Wzi family protein, partial [Candidatus Acidiferrales bacterium]
DSYHFGQTIAYDFGRPFERGFNGQIGGAFRAAAGPLAIYVRAEYQHAPAAPAPSPAVVNFISQADGGTAIGDPAIPLTEISQGPVQSIDRIQLLDAYATLNLNNWQFALGRQTLVWGPSPDPLLWSDNIEPVNMVRLANPEPFYLPGFLHHIGPIQVDQFFGRLGGHPYVPRPFVYGQKVNFKPLPFLEIGLGRRSMLGGTGSADPLNMRNFIGNFFGIGVGAPPGKPYLASVPGDAESELDWTLYIPKIRNYLVFYGDAYSEDNFLPLQGPTRSPWHPGIYVPRIPGIPKLDFHMEGVSMEQNGLISQIGGGNHGIFNYWNQNYPDGNTNYGDLIGNTVGREGRAIRAWFTYWLSANSTLQFTYKHSTVSADFVPGGGTWQDYGVRNELNFANGLYVKSEFQYEHIARFPLLFNGPRNNFTAIVEVGFHPLGRLHL